MTKNVKKNRKKMVKEKLKLLKEVPYSCCSFSYLNMILAITDIHCRAIPVMH